MQQIQTAQFSLTSLDTLSDCDVWLLWWPGENIKISDIRYIAVYMVK